MQDYLYSLVIATLICTYIATLICCSLLQSWKGTLNWVSWHFLVYIEFDHSKLICTAFWSCLPWIYNFQGSKIVPSIICFAVWLLYIKEKNTLCSHYFVYDHSSWLTFQWVIFLYLQSWLIIMWNVLYEHVAIAKV